MSSGKIEQNYFKNVEHDSIFSQSVIFSEDIIPKSHFSDSELHKEMIYIDFELKLEHNYEEVIDNHLKMIQKIDIILQNSQHLTQKQKYDYCNSQRFYMKLYLKEIYSKV